MAFIINITNTSGDTGTIVPDAGFSYTDQLNRINQANLKFSGIGSIRRGLLEVGSEIEIKRNGVREFYGLVQDINFLSGGAVVANVSGFEVWLGIEDGVYTNSPYTSTASATIASEIIAESTKFTAGTIEAGTNIDFRIQNTDSLYTGLSNLVRKTQQDIGVDYANFEIDVLDHKGSPTSVATLNAGVEISNVRIDKFFPKGNVVRVLGKSEGQTKVCATCCDASSIATFGRISTTIRDRTATTNAEAGKLAAAELAVSKQIIKIYDFDVNNLRLNIVSGDVLTLNARSQGISSESVRTVGVLRGVQGDEEFMTLQVTNTEYARSLKRRNEIISEVEKASRQNEDYDQYETEYSNQTVATCVGGIMCAGAAGGSTVILDAGCIFAADAINIGASSPFNYIGANTVTGCGLVLRDVVEPTLASDAATKNYVDTTSGGTGLWVCEAAQSFQPCDVDSSIIPNCSVGGSNLNSVGTSTCPWTMMRGNCVLGVTCVCSPRVCGSTCVRGAVLCATSCVGGASTFGLFNRVNINGSSACQLYVGGNAVVTGVMTISNVLTMGNNICMAGFDLDGVDNLCVDDIFACAGTNICFNDDLVMLSGDVITVTSANLNLCGGGDPVVIGAGSVAGTSDDLEVIDDLFVNGTKSAIVPYNGCKITYYSVESPESWFVEKCSSKLIKGFKEIILDERFVGTTIVNEDHPLFVNLTPTSDSKGMIVEKMFDRIIVKELNGKSDATFDVEISAKRKGYEEIRYAVEEFDNDIETWVKFKVKEKVKLEKEDRKTKILLRFLRAKQYIKNKRIKKEDQEFVEKFQNKTWVKKSLEVLKNA